VTTWKREAQAGLQTLFKRKRGRRRLENGTDVDAWYGQLGRLQAPHFTGLVPQAVGRTKKAPF
jgi:hypothetical protein